MKYYYIKDKNGKVEIQTRKIGITLTRIKRLEEQGKTIFKVVEIDDKILEFFQKKLLTNTGMCAIIKLVKER